MTPDHDNDHNHDNREQFSLALRSSLRAMRKDVMPEGDLWPSISRRIGNELQTPAPRATPSARRFRTVAPLALAASLVIALGVAWQTRIENAPTTAAPTAGLIAREAGAMTIEYQAAWRILDAHRSPDIDASALHQLDRSAAQVRDALRRDPNARYLFDRLQHLYTLRLDLAQRLASST